MLVPRNLSERWLRPAEGLPMLFVHTPKCGGSYVQQAFGAHAKKCRSVNDPLLAGHLTWRQYRDRLALIGQSIHEMTTFSVVRNPYDWHVSWFNYIRKPKGGRRSGYHVEHHLFQKMDFSDYVQWLEDPSAIRSILFDMGRQVSDWIIDETGRIVVTEVMRQERLEEDLEVMKQRYNLLIKAPDKKVNTSNSRDYRSFYTSKDVDLITRRHQRDLDMFGYSFE